MLPPIAPPYQEPSTGAALGFWPKALAIAAVVIAIAALDKISPRAAAAAVVVVLLSVLAAQRQGVLQFAAWFSQQTNQVYGSGGQ